MRDILQAQLVKWLSVRHVPDFTNGVTAQDKPGIVPDKSQDQDMASDNEKDPFCQRNMDIFSAALENDDHSKNNHGQ